MDDIHPSVLAVCVSIVILVAPRFRVACATVFGVMLCLLFGPGLGVLLVGSSDFNFLGFYMKHNKETESFNFLEGFRSQPSGCLRRWRLTWTTGS